VLLLQDVVGGGQVNHVFWSVAVEWQISLLFPLLVVVWLRRGLVTAAVAGLGASALGCALTQRDPRLGPAHLAGLTPQFLGLFVLGMLAAHVCTARGGRASRLRDATPWTSLFVVFALGLAVACSALGGFPAVSAHFAWLDAVAGLSAASLLVAICRPGASRLGTVLASRPLAFLGTFAYSVYLVHAPLLQLVWQYGLAPAGRPPAQGFALLVVLGIPLVVVAARAFFAVCERPFLSARQRAAVADAAGATSPATGRSTSRTSTRSAPERS
jgi:peptidoglycan/LPS O-acetylase OafA/YrhL